MTRFDDGAPKDELMQGRAIEFRSLDLRRFRPTAAEACLNAEERERARRFSRSSGRDAFVGGRYLVRHALSRLLDRAPDRVSLSINPHGRPLVEGVGGRPPLVFSLAHSGEMVVCAITGSGRLGADVETLDRAGRVAELEALVLHQEERPPESVCSSGMRRKWLLQTWVLKEAYVKALGEGLAIPFSTFRASPAHGGITIFSHEPSDPLDRRAFAFRPLIGTGFETAVVWIAGSPLDEAPAISKYMVLA
jgi:4'-phosphopantetheinyl transferase